MKLNFLIIAGLQNYLVADDVQTPKGRFAMTQPGLTQSSVVQSLLTFSDDTVDTITPASPLNPSARLVSPSTNNTVSANNATTTSSLPLINQNQGQNQNQNQTNNLIPGKPTYSANIMVLTQSQAATMAGSNAEILYFSNMLVSSIAFTLLFL